VEARGFTTREESWGGKLLKDNHCKGRGTRTLAAYGLISGVFIGDIGDRRERKLWYIALSENLR